MLGDILAGYRVIDLTQNVAGPYCAQVLGDLGAEVIKVERPGAGDDSRSWRSPQPGSLSSHFVALNRNKRSICVDVSTDEGRAVVRRLALHADVFLHSMKPGSAEARGFGWGELSAANPALVYCAVSAYGETGPLKSLPGYDPVMQAFSGLMSLCGSPGDEPSRVPVSIVDVGTGMWAAIGILGACLQRVRTGQGSRVAVSLLETSVGWMNALVTAYAMTGKPPARIGTALSNAAPYELFRASGGYVMLAAPNDRLFAAACNVLGLAGLPQDARFTTNALRLENRAELHRLIEERTREIPALQLVQLLREAGVPSGEMNDFPQAMAHPQVQAVGMTGEWAQGVEGMPPLVETPLRMDGARSQKREPPPALGQHTDEVLRRAGFSADELRKLREQRTIA